MEDEKEYTRPRDLAFYIEGIRDVLDPVLDDMSIPRKAKIDLLKKLGDAYAAQEKKIREEDHPSILGMHRSFWDYMCCAVRLAGDS